MHGLALRLTGLKLGVCAGTKQGLQVREVQTEEEIKQVARLRADAFYEDNFSRFVSSFKAQFADRVRR